MTCSDVCLCCIIHVFAVVFILSARVSSSYKMYVSRETAEVGVAICIKPAEARNEAWEPPWTIHCQTTVHGTG